MKHYKIFITALIVTLAFQPFGYLLNVHSVQAQEVVSPLQKAFVSITFDDGVASTYDNALPVLSQRNIPATAYVNPGLVGNDNEMTWQEIIELQNKYGWEIGSHTITHPDMVTLGSDALKREIVKSKQMLESRGLRVTNFASPYGSYDGRALAFIAQQYLSHRGFSDSGSNVWPYEPTILKVRSVEHGVTPEQVYAWIDDAAERKEWLILVYHEIGEYDGYLYSNTPEELAAVADYVNANRHKIAPVTVHEAMTQLGQAIAGLNVFPNSQFESGLTSGWTTDDPKRVTKNTNSKGRAPEAKNSIRLVQNQNQNVHLFSPSVSINAATTYVISTYVDAVDLKTGEAGMYIDEYSASGQWISGQWLGMVSPGWARDLVRYYSPSSTAVASVRVQVYASAGNKGKVFVDNVTMVPFNSTTVTKENLVANGGFEVIENNWPINWIQDTSNFSVVPSTVAQGQYGLRALPASQNVHLFSDPISVEHGAQYDWQQYIRTSDLSGEYGFYIDEYDTGGNWVSGQWKGMISAPFNGIYSTRYTPTSANVTRIRLQYYFAGGSQGLVEMDEVVMVNTQ